MQRFSFKKISLVFALWWLACGFTVIGHRGDPIKQPEETIASFNQAFSEGANYVELDLHVSQDNVLVVSHDRNLQRITGHNNIVSQTPWATIKTFKQANGEPMHSLADIFTYYQNKPNTKFLIETKKTKKGNPQNMESLAAALINQYHMTSRVMFHSFSLASLQTLKTLLPTVPRIFIAGSLKRINFETFATSTGVNISSELVNAQIIKQLHAANQKVYVWDHMNENADRWNWLVNLPIDGVVTNYPATGKQYQDAKTQATTKKVSFDATLLSNTAAISYENPYNLTLKKTTVQPLATYHVTQLVWSKGHAYYQIGTNRFIEATGVNRNEDFTRAEPYLNQTLQLRTDLTQAQFYNQPYAPQSLAHRLLPGQRAHIEAVQILNDNLWLQTKKGWLKGSDVLIDFDQNSANWRAYQHLTPHQKLALVAIKSSKILQLNTKKQNKWQMLAYFHYNQVIMKSIL
ncbi:glycerophosphodiester phosphodiesterase [Lapidilactobacillus bayanensis]|uniref:glycerophosphodiester phosphodiesterase n=1 Tax=Lapidilactobacillus bayanensis TaxID=2485998 RepID=UPI0013DE4992|nr:glycerophosphodiester phosphodiesterase [Lapidilactobacillus bayanensis]